MQSKKNGKRKCCDPHSLTIKGYASNARSIKLKIKYLFYIFNKLCLIILHVLKDV